MGENSLPTIIQGGMGAGVSGWRLAKAVSRTGQMGVVSGTALDVIMSRRLQLGDIGGHVRRALEHFPFAGTAQRIIDRYFIPGGKATDAPFKPKPVFAVQPKRMLEELLVASNFVEVFLAKEGHDRPVGVNFLEKIQIPTLPSIYGAMLAGVSWVLMGAGIPMAIPGILDRLAALKPVSLRLDVQGAGPNEEFHTHFDPVAFSDGQATPLDRPNFAAIISSATLGRALIKRASGEINGFIIEGPTAGGHNAPPRGQMQLNEIGEPVYGERDDADLDAIEKLGKPFWLAGSQGTPEAVVDALDAGAAGVQVGTAFAYCEESDLDPAIKSRVLEASRRGEIQIFTDPKASPTGFPFKVVPLEGTVSQESEYLARTRICDLAYLRNPYKKEDGTVGWRCSSEPVDDFVRKGGKIEETVGRKCVCNALMANIGLGQRQKDGSQEKPLVTSGNDVAEVARFLVGGKLSYRASEVVEYLLGPLDIDAVVQPAVATV